MKRLAPLLLALAAFVALPACSNAQTLVDLQVLDLERQETLPQHPHRGRSYVEGRPGHRYALVLQNLTGQRVLAVVSVDGVNAISGETAGSQQSGYVLEPWQRMEVRGWRKNLSEVAEFHFTALEGSYAARTGRPRNVGVIGVAAFRERQRPEPQAWTAPPPASPYAEMAADDAAKASGRAAEGLAGSAAPAEADARREAAPAARQQLGTGHGQRRWDAASTTTFEREGQRPNQVLSLWYDSAQALVARGVLPTNWPPAYGSPEAFPIGFAPDP